MPSLGGQLRTGRGACRYTEVGGSEGIVAGCLVAVKQLMPENEVTLLGFIRFRAKVWGPCKAVIDNADRLTGHGWRAERHALCASQLLPSLFVVCAGLAGVVLGSALSTVPFVCFGTYLSWVYLRFLQPNPELDVRCVSPLACRSLAVARVRIGLCQDALTWQRSRHRGDALNDDFRFATFFPEVLHPAIDKLAAVLGKLICFQRTSPEAAGSFAPGASAQPPGPENADAARRR